jgi:choline-sulfatase
VKSRKTMAPKNGNSLNGWIDMKTILLYSVKKQLLYLSVVLMIGVPGCQPGPPEKPNIILIFADDQCYETIHALGNDEIITPNLDRIAGRGVTFTRAYNMGGWHGAVCVASRTMLNTGLFLWHARQETTGNDNIERWQEQGKMWSQLMEKAGYDTYMTGKWHVGADAEKTFMTATDIRGGMPNQTPEGYNRPIEGQADVWSPYDTAFGGFWKGGTHWTEKLANTAASFIESAAGKDKPFFMYLAFNAVHDPRQSPKEYVDMYPLENISLPVNFLPEYPYKDSIGCDPGLRDEKLVPFPRTPYAIKVNRQEYYALATYMDEQIGRILDAIDQSGKSDNTYIFFTADHGLGVGQHGLVGKQNMYDHSVRVPLMVYGKGIPENIRLDMPVYLQDIMPSTLELAGIEVPDYVEFKSLFPLIRGEESMQYDAIYGAYTDRQRMITRDGYKLILYPRVPAARLYCLAEDPYEMKDLSGDPSFEGKMKELFHSFLHWQEETGDTLDIRSAFTDLL